MPPQQDRDQSTKRTPKSATGRGAHLSPGLIVGGAAAIGAVAAVLLPVSKIERDIGKPIGEKMLAKGKGALRAAKSAAVAELQSVPLNTVAATAQASRTVDRVVEETLSV